MLVLSTVAIAAFLIAVILIVVRVGKPDGTVRSDQEQRNDSFNTPSNHQTRWHIAHVRDDVAGVGILLQVIPVLFTAILCVLIVR